MKMPAEGSTKKKKCQWGGKRAGAGRPCTETVPVEATVQRKTAEVLERIAKGLGLSRKRRGVPFLGAAIDELASRVDMPEPGYLKLAREVREQSLRSAGTCQTV